MTICLSFFLDSSLEPIFFLGTCIVYSLNYSLSLWLFFILDAPPLCQNQHTHAKAKVFIIKILLFLGRVFTGKKRGKKEKLFSSNGIVSSSQELYGCYASDSKKWLQENENDSEWRLETAMLWFLFLISIFE